MGRVVFDWWWLQSRECDSYIGPGYMDCRKADIHEWIPILLLILTIVAVVIFMTELMTNSAISVLMLTILGAAAVGMGVSPLLLMVPATIAASCAFMLPSATAPNAIVFSSGHVTIPQMARTGLRLNIIGIFIITAIVYLIAIPLFSITLDSVPDWAR